MPAIPGTVDGNKVPDKRTYIMPGEIIRYYKRLDKWDNITDVRARTGDKYDTITVRLCSYKHTWRLEGGRGKHSWRLIKEDYVR